MARKIVKWILWALLALLVLFAIQIARNWDTIRRTMLGGLHVYETTPPAVPADIKRPAILVFSKTNGFRHEEAIPAANALFAQMAKDNGWGYFQTENGAAFDSAILSRFDAVVFNNVSGDVFTPKQRDHTQSRNSIFTRPQPKAIIRRLTPLTAPSLTSQLSFHYHEYG